MKSLELETISLREEILDGFPNKTIPIEEINKILEDVKSVSICKEFINRNLKFHHLIKTKEGFSIAGGPLPPGIYLRF